VFALAIVLFMVVGSFMVYAQSVTQGENNAEIAQAYACVDDNIADSSSISLSEAVLAALSGSADGGISAIADKIQTTFNDREVGTDCYAETGSTCRIKDTAQVALAKMKMDEDVTGEIAWLESQTGAIQGFTWFLQITIENNLPGECLVRYQGADHTINVRDDLKIEGNPGSCLQLANSDYWLRISESCIDETIEISCGNGNFTEFFTNLVYQKSGEATTFVSSTTNRKSANAFATEEISALCFKEGGNCDYEGSLWATFALYKAGKDTGSYAPFLRALSTGQNERYFPSAFLFRIIQDTSLTDEQYNNILSEQRPGGLFRVGNTPYNKFYDTALAMMALGSGSGADATELRESAVPGLFSEQGGNGCFGNPTDTAFILHASGWSRDALPEVCADEGERTSIEEPSCCNGLTELGDLTVDGNGACVDGGGEYGYCADVDDLVCGDNENICNSQTDCEADVEANTCLAGRWYAGDPVVAINTSEESGYCDLVDAGDGWENGCCVLGSECTGSGSSSICEVIPGEDTNRVDGCYRGSWYDENGAEIDTTDNAGYCHLEEDDESYPYGCCIQGFECKYDVGNETESVCERRPGGGRGGGSQTDCDVAGYSCVASLYDCLAEGGSKKGSFDCPGFDICCTIDIQSGESCTDKGGIVCQEEEVCSGSTEFSSSGPCCTGGICEEPEDECSSNSDCSSGEECRNGQCRTKTSGGPTTPTDEGGLSIWWWVFIFGILILLVVLGIVYRDRLRVWMFKMKGKTKTSKAEPPGRGPPGAAIRRAPPRFGEPGRLGVRRPGMRPPIRSARPGPATIRARKPASDKEREMEETLKKLKEMSK